MATKTVFVKPNVSLQWNYAWTTKNYDATLGHSEWTGATPSGPLVFGCNSLKPNRATKVLSTGKSTSTFVEAGKEDDAKTAGMKISIATVKTQPKGKQSKAVAIKLQTGLFHCWSMPLTLYTALGSGGRADLGIVDATTVPANDRVWGANGYVLTEAALNIPAGTRFPIKRFHVTYTGSSGKQHKTFAAPDSPHVTGGA